MNLMRVGVAAVTAVSWLATDALPWPAQLLTVALLGLLPAIALAQAKQLAELGVQRLPRMQLYASSAISLWLLAFFALAAASASRFTPGIIGLRALDTGPFLAWVVVGIGAAAVLLAAGKVFGIEESPLLVHLLPVTPRERVVFSFLSVTAGVCEELVFRGFLIAALTFVSGSVLFSAVLSSLLFGLLHAYQSPTGAMRAAVLGFALAMPMVVAGRLQNQQRCGRPPRVDRDRV
jgi:membrane protease YdiL (CAAX protease family)